MIKVSVLMGILVKSVTDNSSKAYIAIMSQIIYNISDIIKGCSN